MKIFENINFQRHNLCVDSSAERPTRPRDREDGRQRDDQPGQRVLPRGRHQGGRGTRGVLAGHGRKEEVGI